jgi:hypothetical protein
MIAKKVIFLQDHTNSAMEVPGPCGERNPLSGDASQANKIKVEEVSDAEEDPISGDASQAIKIKVEVSDAKEDPISDDASQAIKIKVEEVSDAEEDPVSGDASQAIKIKLEKVSDAEEEVGPFPISFPKIKVESEVRCMSLYMHGKK